jgi:hypothetical protein
MAETTSQTLANHARYDPLYHFFMAPLAVALLVWAIAHLVRHPSNEAIAWVALGVLVFLMVFKLRAFPLRAQDRVIRLEERMRLAKLAADSTIPALTEGQLIALRFACDEELPSLAQKAAANNLTPKQIKEAIQTWRADYFRV